MKTRYEIEDFVRGIIKSAQGEVDAIIDEVARHDDYRLEEMQKWSPQPDTVLDLGANVGVFTLAARCAFPDAYILAIEPSEKAWAEWTRYIEGLPKIQGMLCGIGNNNMLAEVSTAGSLGTTRYGEDEHGVTWGPRLSDLPVDWDKNVLVKMDIEGGEMFIRNHGPSESCLRKAWAIVGELHWGGPRFGYSDPREWLTWFPEMLEDTHEILACNNTHPTRDPVTGSGCIAILAVRKDVQYPNKGV